MGDTCSGDERVSDAGIVVEGTSGNDLSSDRVIRGSAGLCAPAFVSCSFEGTSIFWEAPKTLTSMPNPWLGGVNSKSPILSMTNLVFATHSPAAITQSVAAF